MNEDMNKKVAVVTGARSGIGRETALMLSKEGYKVYDFSRHDGALNGVIHITADVTDTVSIQKAFSAVLEKEKRLDLLVTCAGMGVSGAVEFSPENEMRRQFEVNLFGTINTVQAIIPFMRKAGHGRIICISSVAGVYSIPYQTYYSASKAAINSFVDGLTNELRQFGVSICAVMPGDIKTGFTDARHKVCDGDDIYGGRISKSVASMEKDERNGMSPEQMADFIVKIAEKKRIKPLYTAGAMYKALVFLSRILTHNAVVRLVGKLYNGK